MIGKILCFTNQKGGTSKTVTSYNVANFLSEMGKRVLLIDTDGQASLTTLVTKAQGIKAQMLSECIFSKDLKLGIQKIGNLAFIGTNEQIKVQPINYNTFKSLLQPIREYFDYIVIDTPPELGQITISVLTACDGVFITTTADRFAIEGIIKVANTVKSFTKAPKMGIVFTQYEGYTTIAKELYKMGENIGKQLGIATIQPPIRKSVAVTESLATMLPLSEYAPNSKPSEDYEKLVKNIVKMLS